MFNVISHLWSNNRGATSGAKGAALCFGLLTVSVSGVGISTAHAARPMIEEVQVTARRREERDIDIPIAVKALDAEMLRQQNIVELNDLGVQVPSLRISNAGTSTNNPIVSIRGQRPTDLLLTNDQAVPIYINDVVITPSEGSNLALYDLENIQVIKGPQGTLFGRNSTGGTLLIATRRPGTELGGYMEVKIGNYNMKSIETGFDLPVNDVLQFRVSGRALKRDGYQTNVAANALNGQDYWDEDSSGARISMNVDLETFRNLTTVSYDQNEMVGRLAVVEAFNANTLVGTLYNDVYNQNNQIYNTIDRQSGRSAHDVEADVLGSDVVRVWFGSNTTEIDLSDQLTLKTILGYRNTYYETASDSDGTALPMFGARTSKKAFVTFDPETQRTEAEQFSAELQLGGDLFDGRLEWLAGAFWFKMEGTYGDGITQVLGGYPNYATAQADGDINPALFKFASSNAAGGIWQRSPSGDVYNDALGYFGEGTFNFTDQWAMTLGLRYSEDKRKVTVRNFSGSGSGVNPDFVAPAGGNQFSCVLLDEQDNNLSNAECARTEEETFNAVTWRASLEYTPMDGMLVFGSVSTGYRAGGFNMRGNNNSTLEPFDEEEVLNYELGFKADWSLTHELPFRSNVAIYRQEYDNIQRTQQSYNDSTGSFGTETINAAEAIIQGAEIDLTWMATDSLTFNLAYAYTDAYYKNWITNIIEIRYPVGGPCDLFNPCNVPVDASDDGDFTYVPEHSATFSINYFLPVDPAMGDISLMASVYWQDEMYTHALGDFFDEMAALQSWTAQDVEQANSTVIAESYEVVNLRADWRSVMSSEFDIALFVNNATDEEYKVGGLNVIDLLGISASTYGAPRTFGAAIRYNF